ncbi:pyridoxal-dependent decarboxylase [Sporosarcina sp. BP05]|uniref:pyridoxal-dependent decarboxylase n=1 Tax=Sporosarcina sp. BP05 TaxID=2758726 RepID=UPI001C96BF38|nr:pyridoxal-dependent decarboxylase [Sporosarcina sp. BP05]
METPFFLINKEELEDNILSFESALKKIWPNSRIAYSVKTNSLPWLLKHLKTQNVIAEVVSDEEYELALLCGYKEEEIVFNGPIKGKAAFLDSINKNSIVNIDSQHELEVFKSNIKESKGNIGVRVNIDTSIFESNDIGYIEDGFRFGFSDENDELSNAIEIIRFGDMNNRIGLHFHCNSVTRSLSVYRKLAEYAKFIIEKYNISPSFIDIGGGFFGGVEGKPTGTDYITAIHEVLKNTVNIETTMLIVEPGSAIIGSAVEFHTSVIDTKDNDRTRIVTTDGSRINIDPLWSKKNYTYRIEKNTEARIKLEKQVICGYTCMDHDRIMSLLDENILSIGDRLIYEKVGAYTMTFGGPFIRYFPDVYVQNKNSLDLVRKRMKVRDYYDIHTK